MRRQSSAAAFTTTSQQREQPWSPLINEGDLIPSKTRIKNSPNGHLASLDLLVRGGGGKPKMPCRRLHTVLVEDHYVVAFNADSCIARAGLSCVNGAGSCVELLAGVVQNDVTTR
jgi:hypothetical protein